MLNQSGLYPSTKSVPAVHLASFLGQGRNWSMSAHRRDPSASGTHVPPARLPRLRTRAEILPISPWRSAPLSISFGLQLPSDKQVSVYGQVASIDQVVTNVSSRFCAPPTLSADDLAIESNDPLLCSTQSACVILNHSANQQGRCQLYGPAYHVTLPMPFECVQSIKTMPIPPAL